MLSLSPSKAFILLGTFLLSQKFIWSLATRRAINAAAYTGVKLGSCFHSAMPSVAAEHISPRRVSILGWWNGLVVSIPIRTGRINRAEIDCIILCQPRIRAAAIYASNAAESLLSCMRPIRSAHKLINCSCGYTMIRKTAPYLRILWRDSSFDVINCPSVAVRTK